MTDTLVTSAPSAPSVIVTALLRVTRFRGNVLDDSIWGRGGSRTNYLGTPNENTFNNWVANRDGWAMAQLAEAHALDVLHDAYKLNDAWIGMSDDLTFTPANPFAHIDAMIHEEFPGAIPDAKLNKLRTLAQERLDLKSEIESYKRALQEPITNGHDPRIGGLLRVAAQEAIDRDYCEIYDQISEVAGFPTREELGMNKRSYCVTIQRVMLLTPDEAAKLSVRDVASSERACVLDYEELEN